MGKASYSAFGQIGGIQRLIYPCIIMDIQLVWMSGVLNGWWPACIFGTSIMIYNAKVWKYSVNFTHMYIATLPKEHWQQQEAIFIHVMWEMPVQ